MRRSLAVDGISWRRELLPGYSIPVRTTIRNTRHGPKPNTEPPSETPPSTLTSLYPNWDGKMLLSGSLRNWTTAGAAALAPDVRIREIEDLQGRRRRQAAGPRGSGHWLRDQQLLRRGGRGGRRGVIGRPTRGSGRGEHGVGLVSSELHFATGGEGVGGGGHGGVELGKV